MALINELKLDSGALSSDFINEYLLIVHKSGKLKFYQVESGELRKTHSLENEIVDCKFLTEEGVVVLLTVDFEFLIVNVTAELREIIVSSFLLSEVTLSQIPSHWLLIPNFKSFPSIVVSSLSSGVVLVNPNDATINEFLQDYGKIVHFSLSYNSKYLAFYTEEGKFFVTSVKSQFKEILLDFPSPLSNELKDMRWCGSDCVCLYFDQLLLVIGPFGGWIKFNYDELYMFTECDGLSLLTFSKHEFLYCVTEATEKVFSVGSFDNGALLYDAYSQYTKKDSTCNNILKNLSDKGLFDGVNCCLDAALYEYDIYKQKTLIKAAWFGSSFMAENVSDKIVSVCSTLRVLNCLREYKMPLSYLQFRRLGNRGIINRLINKRLFLLALKIAEWLNISYNSILVEWCLLKMKKGILTDEQLALEIHDKLSKWKNVSFAEVAKVAFANGRSQLCGLLLEYEPKVVEQVPLLLSMEEYELALVKSIQSGDTDLVYVVLLHLKRKLPLADFFKLVSTHPAASRLLEVYLKARDEDMLKEFYYQDDKRYESATFLFREGLQELDVNEKKIKVKSAYKQIKDQKEHSFASRMMDQAGHLITMQEKLEQELSITDLIGKDVAYTMFQLYIHPSGDSHASKLIRDFKVNEKLVWNVKIDAFVHLRDLEALDKLSRSKKSPVGYAVFADACLKLENNIEAKKYISKIVDPATKVKYFIKIGAFREAIDIAVFNRNLEQLLAIKNASKSSTLKQEIDGIIQRLSKRE